MASLVDSHCHLDFPDFADDLDGIVARAAFRLVAVSTGLDPHCLGVPEVTFYRDPEAYRAAVAGFMAGTEEGVAAWILYCCKALEAGAREATSIADAAGA